MTEASPSKRLEPRPGVVSLWVWSTDENANEVRDRIVPAGIEPSFVEWSTAGDSEHIYFLLRKLDHSASFFKDAVLPLVRDERFERSGDWFYENAALKFFGVIAVKDHACDYPPGAWGDDAVRFLGSYSYDSTAPRIGTCLGEDPATVAIGGRRPVPGRLERRQWPDLTLAVPAQCRGLTAAAVGLFQSHPYAGAPGHRGTSATFDSRSRSVTRGWCAPGDR